MDKVRNYLVNILEHLEAKKPDTVFVEVCVQHKNECTSIYDSGTSLWTSSNLDSVAPHFSSSLRPWFTNEMQNRPFSEKGTLDHWAAARFVFLPQVRSFWHYVWFRSGEGGDRIELNRNSSHLCMVVLDALTPVSLFVKFLLSWISFLNQPCLTMFLMLVCVCLPVSTIHKQDWTQPMNGITRVALHYGWSRCWKGLCSQCLRDDHSRVKQFYPGWAAVGCHIQALISKNIFKNSIKRWLNIR